MIFASYKAHKDNSKQTHPSHDLWCWNLENPSDRLFWTRFWVCTYFFAETEFCFEFFSFSYWVLGNSPPLPKKSCSSFCNISTKNSYLDQFWLLFMGQFWSSEQDPIFVQQYMVLCLFCLLGSTKKRSIQKFKNWELNNFGNVPFCEQWRGFLV